VQEAACTQGPVYRSQKFNCQLIRFSPQETGVTCKPAKKTTGDSPAFVPLVGGDDPTINVFFLKDPKIIEITVVPLCFIAIMGNIDNTMNNVVIRIRSLKEDYIAYLWRFFLIGGYFKQVLFGERRIHAYPNVGTEDDFFRVYLLRRQLVFFVCKKPGFFIN
jgi:hypothetical protein